MNRFSSSVIDPQTEQVCVFRPGQEVRVLTKTDRLDGADVLPDFDLSIAELLAA